MSRAEAPTATHPLDADLRCPEPGCTQPRPTGWKTCPVHGKLDHLVHRLWTKAVGTAGYDKEEWKELARRLGV